MGSVFLSGDDEIIVIDPMNEYFDIAQTYGCLLYTSCDRSYRCSRCHYPCKKCYGICTGIPAAGFIYYCLLYTSSGLQKKHYAKLYWVGKLKKRPYSQVWKYREDIRKMHKLQEQYLFLARHNIHSCLLYTSRCV